jgi:hypothetical protein
MKNSYRCCYRSKNNGTFLIYYIKNNSTIHCINGPEFRDQKYLAWSFNGIVIAEMNYAYK